MGFFNVKDFLTYGGWVLVIVGILGFFLIGPTAEKSILGATWWFDNSENWAHLVLGVVALLLVYLVDNDELMKDLDSYYYRTLHERNTFSFLYKGLDYSKDMAVLIHVIYFFLIPFLHLTTLEFENDLKE